MPSISRVVYAIIALLSLLFQDAVSILGKSSIASFSSKLLELYWVLKFHKSNQKVCPGLLILMSADGTAILEVINKNERKAMSGDEAINCGYINGGLVVIKKSGAHHSETSYPYSLDKILGNIIAVENDLTICETDLSSFNFPVLEIVGGSMSLHSISSLKSFIWLFPNLTTIMSDLMIAKNPNLLSLEEAFPSLVNVGNSLLIGFNDRLETIENAFVSLQNVHSNIKLLDNPNLLSIEGSFHKVVSVFGQKENPERSMILEIEGNSLIMFDSCFSSLKNIKNFDFFQSDIGQLEFSDISETTKKLSMQS